MSVLPRVSCERWVAYRLFGRAVKALRKKKTALGNPPYLFREGSVDRHLGDVHANTAPLLDMRGQPAYLEA